MDEAGFATAHIAGNSLGGYVALQLAARGRARDRWSRSRPPAAGRRATSPTARRCSALQPTMLEQLAGRGAARRRDRCATAEGRRRATQFIAERSEHIPAELIAHQILGAARCVAAAR